MLEKLYSQLMWWYKVDKYHIQIEFQCARIVERVIPGRLITYGFKYVLTCFKTI